MSTQDRNDEYELSKRIRQVIGYTDKRRTCSKASVTQLLCSMQQLCVRAVSYTHLDVYKRQELIDNIFAAHFANPDLTADDAAVLNPPVGKMAVSTDGFIVSPAFFPGGNIGKLSICGTVNDLRRV